MIRALVYRSSETPTVYPSDTEPPNAEQWGFHGQGGKISQRELFSYFLNGFVLPSLCL